MLTLLALFVSSRTTFWDMDVQGARYRLEVASTSAAQQKGLAGRDHLPAQEGMIFVFPQPAERCFWMKDMRFPLDIVWADKSQIVVRIEPRVSPATYPKPFCAGNAMYIIELPGGTAGQGRIQVGDRLKF